MFVHAIVLTDHSDEVVSRIKEKYPKCYSVNESCFLVRCDDLTQDVAIAVGIKGEDRVEDAGGVVLKLNGAYSGFASRMAVTRMDDYRQESPAPASGGGGGGNDLDGRLRAVEMGLARVETELKHVVTKTWVLAGVLAGMGVAAGVAVGIGVALVKLLPSGA